MRNLIFTFMSSGGNTSINVTLNYAHVFSYGEGYLSLVVTAQIKG